MFHAGLHSSDYTELPKPVRDVRQALEGIIGLKTFTYEPRTGVCTMSDVNDFNLLAHHFFVSELRENEGIKFTALVRRADARYTVTFTVPRYQEQCFKDNHGHKYTWDKGK